MFTKIEPQPSHSDIQAKRTLDWLSKGDDHGTEDYGALIRLMIAKINDLSGYCKQLEERIDILEKCPPPANND